MKRDKITIVGAGNIGGATAERIVQTNLADVVLVDDVMIGFQRVNEIEEQEGRKFVHPFNDPRTVLGTGTLGLEFYRQAGSLDLAILPIGDFDVVGYFRFVISGAFSWLILSGAIYLVGRYALEGEGSFQGVLAMTALAHPVLLLVLAARALGLPAFLALLVGTVWFLAILVAGTRVALSLILERAVLAVAGGYVLWLIFSRFLV